MVKESTEWAKLESACSMKICDFIDSLQTAQELLYLFDWSIPTHAPELAKELVIPKYFAGDFLQRTSPGSLYQDIWPSLFIAPAGLHSGLHVDAFGSNFWMALFQGRKRLVMPGIYIIKLNCQVIMSNSFKHSCQHRNFFSSSSICTCTAHSLSSSLKTCKINVWFI